MSYLQSKSPNINWPKNWLLLWLGVHFVSWGVHLRIFLKIRPEKNSFLHPGGAGAPTAAPGYAYVWASPRKLSISIMSACPLTLATSVRAVKRHRGRPPGRMCYVSDCRVFKLLDTLPPTATRPHGLPAWFLANVNTELKFMFDVIGSPSVVCRLSSVTFVRPTQAIQIFRNISMACDTLAIRELCIKILRRSSQGNPSVGGVKHKRCSRI